jgi:hypothetical protein
MGQRGGATDCGTGSTCPVWRELVRARTPLQASNSYVLGSSTGGVIGVITYATPLGPSRSCIVLGHGQGDGSDDVKSEQDVWAGGTGD